LIKFGERRIKMRLAMKQFMFLYSTHHNINGKLKHIIGCDSATDDKN
jgi:hypothetical protein